MTDTSELTSKELEAYKGDDLNDYVALCVDFKKAKQQEAWLKHQLATTKQKLDVAVEALEFYANDDRDDGRRAQEALSTIREN